MPIRDEALKRPENRFVGVKSGMTFGEAVGLLRTLRGRSSWHLVVQKDDGSWWANRFNEIASQFSEGEAQLMSTRLENLEALIRVRAAEQDSMGTGVAEETARTSPGNLLVVTQQGQLKGVLSASATVKRGITDPNLARFRPLPLESQEVNLDEFSDSLLGPISS